MTLGAAWLGLLGAVAQADPIDFSPGLITTSAIHDGIDYENINVFQGVDAHGSKNAIRWSMDDPDRPGTKKQASAIFVTRAEDLESARRIVIAWQSGDPETMPGSTSGSFSRLVLRELKTRGSSAIIVGAVRANTSNADAGLLSGLMASRKYYRGTLKRIEPGGVPISVLIDGQRKTLTAIHAKGDVTVGGDAGSAEFWILDDDQHPLTLRWVVLGSSVTTVRIDNPTTRNPHGVADGGIKMDAAAGGSACRVELNGIYFETASAQLLSESHPALQKVIDLMKSHPNWKFTIEGHTDNIGGVEYNMNLSRARAAAVRNALLDIQADSAARLSAQGFGASRPLEPNTSIEGRARNRRVELATQCK